MVMSAAKSQGNDTEFHSAWTVATLIKEFDIPFPQESVHGYQKDEASR